MAATFIPCLEICLLSFIFVSCNGSTLYRRQAPCSRSALQTCAAKMELPGFDMSQLIVNGHLSFTCSASQREESRQCLAPHGNCGGRRFIYLQNLQSVWDRICEHRDAFMSGLPCWGEIARRQFLRSCPRCSLADCVQSGVPGLTGCTSDHAHLIAEILTDMYRNEGRC